LRRFFMYNESTEFERRTAMNSDYRIVEVVDKHLKKSYTEGILHKLPEWFGKEESLMDYVNQVADKPFFGAFKNGECVGFFSGRVHHGRTGEIVVCGIKPEHHRLGLGKGLLEKLEVHFTSKGCNYMMVKTLSDLHPDTHYGYTREFYEAVGFVPFYTDFEIWGADYPCLVMVKELPNFPN